MKKLIPIALSVVLLFALAGCRVASFDTANFIPPFATVVEQSPGHLVLEAQRRPTTFEQAVEFYELPLHFLGAQQVELDDTRDDFWSYTGTYGDGNTIRIIISTTGDFIRILVSFTDEMR